MRPYPAPNIAFAAAHPPMPSTRVVDGSRGERERAWDVNENGVVVGDSTVGTTGENAAVWTLECDR